MTETVVSSPEVKIGTVLTAVDELFDLYKKPSVPRNGQPTMMPDGNIVQLVQINTAFERSHFTFFRHRTSETDRVMTTTKAGESIMVRRTITTSTYPILSLFGLKKQANMSPEITSANETTPKETTPKVTIQVEKSGSLDGQKKWTINPEGELLVNGQVSTEPEELQEALRIVRSLKPSTKEHEAS